MKKFLKSFLNLRITSRNRTEKQDLDYLLEQSSELKNLFQRLDWLSRIIVWLRSPSHIEGLKSQFNDTEIISLRTKFLFQVLSRNEKWKSQFYLNLAKIFEETEVFDLLVETQFSSSNHLFTDIWSRVSKKIIPQPQFDINLIKYFTNLFLVKNDSAWVSALDPQLVREIFYNLKLHNPAVFTKYHEQFLTAIVYLSTKVQSLGLQPEIRERLSKSSHLLSTSFFKIQGHVESFVYITTKEEKDIHFAVVESVIQNCREDIEDVYSHMNSHGVSVDIVLQTKKIISYLDRLQLLMKIEMSEAEREILVLKLVANLIEEAHDRQSVWELFSQTTQLLSQKITERNALTGEHYIAKDNSEYWSILKAAMGGGALTSLTVFIKTITGYLKATAFIEGVLFSLNYSFSFLTIHFFHFTLATKQPAMTAPALAVKLKLTRLKSEYEPVVDEVVKLVRTQFAGIFGNLLFVIPFTLLFSYLSDIIFGAKLFTPAYAEKSFHAHVIYGPSLFFAAFTGVLLWLSGVITGWADNWFHFNQISKAIRQNRVFYLSLGDEGTEKLTFFLEKNFSSLIGNISLGFLLGLLPAFLKFFGLPIDVRHVTLATGTLTASLYTMGFGFIKNPLFWWAVMGIVAIGLMNLTVSFALAFITAIRATRVTGRQRYMLMRFLRRRFLSQPFSFIFPINKKDKRSVEVNQTQVSNKLNRVVNSEKNDK